MTITLSLVRARPGGYVGDGHVHAAVVDAAREVAVGARGDGLVLDAFVTRAGAGLGLVLTHGLPEAAPEVDELALRALGRAGEVAADLGQHDAGVDPERIQRADLAVDGGPVLCFLAGGARAGVWNLVLYRIFADPLTTPALIHDPHISSGFRFVGSAASGSSVFDLPDDLHRLLGAVGAGLVVGRIVSRADGLAVAAASGGCDPVLAVRCGDGGPSVAEALETFACPGPQPWMQGADVLMPVGVTDDGATRLRGPARAVGLGFQVTESGRLVGPRDVLGDRSFEDARREAMRAAAGLPVRLPARDRAPVGL